MIYKQKPSRANYRVQKCPKNDLQTIFGNDFYTIPTQNTSPRSLEASESPENVKIEITSTQIFSVPTKFDYRLKHSTLCMAIDDLNKVFYKASCYLTVSRCARSAQKALEVLPLGGSLMVGMVSLTKKLARIGHTGVLLTGTLSQIPRRGNCSCDREQLF